MSVDMDAAALGRVAPKWRLRDAVTAHWIPLAIGPLGLLLLWAAVYWTGLITQKLLPSPFRTGVSIVTNIWAGGLAYDLGQTVLRTGEAFLIAVAFGLPLGLLIGSSKRVYRSVEFLIDFFRSTPATALFPLFMIVFGLGDLSKIAVAAFSSVLIILFNVAYGVMNARPLPSLDPGPTAILVHLEILSRTRRARAARRAA